VLATLTVLALAAPATAAAVRLWRRAALAAAALVPLGAFVWVLAIAPAVLAEGSLSASYHWAPDLYLDIDLRVDALALTLLLLITGVGAAVLAYSAAYFDATDPSLARSSGVLVGFAAAMFGLVVADNLLLLYVFWELTTVCSFLLIGHEDEDPQSVRSARHALLVTTGFGLAMLLGFVLLGERAGTYQISRIVAEPPTGATTMIAAVLILLGALAKSAQVPLHGWLPDAMIAPTPVSAYLHAAAMVKAGVYLVARLTPAFEGVLWWRTLAVLAGLASLLYGGWQALRQIDLKRLLAYGTISQLGLLTVLAGAGTRTAALALVAMLLAHGLFKSALFLLGGVVEHEFGTRRIGEIPDVARVLPVAAGAAALAGASMIGLPPLLGFVGKEASFAAFEHATLADGLVLAGLALGSALTVAYTIHLLRGGFGRGERSSSTPRWPLGLLAAPVVLSLAGLAGGLAVTGVHRLAAPYAAALPALGQYTLALWHGLTPTLALTVGVLIAGALGYAVRGRLAPGLDPGRRPTESVYRALLTGTHHVARIVTGRIQVGSLPAYLVVIIAVALVLPAAGFLSSSLRGQDVPRVSARLWDNAAQAVLAAVAILCAFAATRARSRLPAVLLAGGVGYAVTGLFFLHGAIDVALTLLLVESLTLIALVLVLRRLPATFPEIGRGPARRTVLTASLATVLGVWIAVLLWVASTARTRPAVSAEYVEKAETAGGTNLVDLILVDFRALDTLFEISVLMVAALGMVNLIAPFLARRRARGAQRRAAPADMRGTTPEPQLATGGEPPVGQRSVILVVAVRVLAPTILLFSVYLLAVGHSAPGGGFVGGLVAGLAYVLRYVAGGSAELRAAWPLPPVVLLGVGLALAATVALAGLPIGGSLLSSGSLTATLPLIGDVKLSSSLLFDAGIYLLVLGLTHTMLATLGSGIDESERARVTDLARGRTADDRRAAP